MEGSDTLRPMTHFRGSDCTTLRRADMVTVMGWNGFVQIHAAFRAVTGSGPPSTIRSSLCSAVSSCLPLQQPPSKAHVV